MTVNDINDSLIKAMEMLAKKNDNDLQTTLTIEATVIETLNEATGAYTVEYLGSRFTAYALTTDISYVVDDRVYVLVPNGDFTSQKMILGYPTSKLDDEGSAKEDLEKVSNDFLDIPDKISFCTYAAAGESDGRREYPVYLTNENLYREVIQEYLDNYGVFQFSCRIKTDIYPQADTTSRRYEGNYGIKIVIKYWPYEELDRNYYTLKTAEAVIDVNSILGNPYEQEVYSLQKAVINSIPVGATIAMDYNPIEISYFVEGFNQDPPVPEGYREDGTFKDDLFIKDIQLCALSQLTPEELSGYAVQFSTNNGTFLSNRSSVYTRKEGKLTITISAEEYNALPPEEQELYTSRYETTTVTAALKANGKDVLGRAVPCYWFKEDGTVDNADDWRTYSPYGGLGWRLLNPVKSEEDKTVYTNSTTLTLGLRYQYDTEAVRRLQLQTEEERHKISDLNIPVKELEDKIAKELEDKALGYLRRVEELRKQMDEFLNSIEEHYQKIDELSAQIHALLRVAPPYYDTVTSSSTYKCVYIYDKQIISKTITIKNLDTNIIVSVVSKNGSNKMISNIGTIDLECKVTDKHGKLLPGNYTYKWTRFNNNNVYIEQLTPEKGKENEVRLTSNYIKNINTVQCTVYNGVEYIGNGYITLVTTNISNYNVDILNTDLKIKYDTDGNSPTSPNYNGPVSSVPTLNPFKIRVYRSDGIELHNDEYKRAEVLWRLPKYSNLNFRSPFSDTEDEETRTCYLYKQNGYDAKMNGIEYSLKGSYNEKNDDNLIEVMVSFDDSVFYDSVEIDVSKPMALSTGFTTEDGFTGLAITGGTEAMEDSQGLALFRKDKRTALLSATTGASYFGANNEIAMEVPLSGGGYRNTIANWDIDRYKLYTKYATQSMELLSSDANSIRQYKTTPGAGIDASHRIGMLATDGTHTTMVGLDGSFYTDYANLGGWIVGTSRIVSSDGNIVFDSSSGTVTGLVTEETKELERKVELLTETVNGLLSSLAEAENAIAMLKEKL